jgi:hypothetical protein
LVTVYIVHDQQLPVIVKESHFFSIVDGNLDVVVVADMGLENAIVHPVL